MTTCLPVSYTGQLEALALRTWLCFMQHCRDKIVHVGTATQDFRSLKENKSYYVLSECISSGHKYLDTASLSHEGVAAGNGKHEHMWLCSAIPSKLCPLNDLSDQLLIIQLHLN